MNKKEYTMLDTEPEEEMEEQVKGSRVFWNGKYCGVDISMPHT